MASQQKLDRNTVKKILPAVVQIVALRQGFLGNLSSAWTGSGTIIHPSGIVLTNCHVANPRAMGMPAPPADKLAIAITEASDQPPVLTYFAEILAQSPKLDLAVLRITSQLDGKSVGRKKMAYIPLGDSDALELGDMLSIFGYPGIGGETVTYTSGAVSGFSQQKDVVKGRAWIKTDATVAGGNSGGTAIDQNGNLVGIPTQAAAGTGISPVDARPVVDTNLDGRIDQRDTPMAVGGFINGLRPINLAKPLLKEAGVTFSDLGQPVTVPADRPKPATSAQKPSRERTGKQTVKPPTPGHQITNLVFSDKVTSDGRPINPGAILSSGRKQLFASFEYKGMKNGFPWEQTWAVDGKQILRDRSEWQDGTKGRKTITLASKTTLPEGEYHLVISVQDHIAAEGQVIIGRRVDDSDTEISGQVIDRQTKRGIPEALVIALKPGVRTDDFIRHQSREMAITSTRTDKYGRFTFPQQLPKGQSYGLIVVARGYRDMAIESALRIGAQAPERAQIYPIPMMKS